MASFAALMHQSTLTCSCMTHHHMITPSPPYSISSYLSCSRHCWLIPLSASSVDVVVVRLPAATRLSQLPAWNLSHPFTTWNTSFNAHPLISTWPSNPMQFLHIMTFYLIWQLISSRKIPLCACISFPSLVMHAQRSIINVSVVYWWDRIRFRNSESQLCRSETW